MRPTDSGSLPPPPSAVGKPPLGFGGSRLRGLLEKPLDRLTAYEGAAIELQLCLSPSDVGWGDVTALLERLADHTLEMTRLHDEMRRLSRLRSVAKQFKPGEVDTELLGPAAPHRLLVHSGVLHKENRARGRLQRTYFLFSDGSILTAEATAGKGGGGGAVAASVVTSFSRTVTSGMLGGFGGKSAKEKAAAKEKERAAAAAAAAERGSGGSGGGGGGGDAAAASPSTAAVEPTCASASGCRSRARRSSCRTTRQPILRSATRSTTTRPTACGPTRPRCAAVGCGGCCGVAADHLPPREPAAAAAAAVGNGDRRRNARGAAASRVWLRAGGPSPSRRVAPRRVHG